MWLWGLFLLFSVPILIHADELTAQRNTPSIPVLLLESFEQYPLRTFPNRWHVRGDTQTAHAIYQIAKEGDNRFLQAHSEKQGIQIGLPYVFQPVQFPRLQWRWRVQQLPSGADERRKASNDSAAGVYVIFDNAVLPRIVKYAWSSSLPVGTRVQNPSYWRLKTIILRSGPSELGEWKHETVDVYQDYKQLFGAEPGEGKGIAVLSSADATQSVASADYDDFVLLAAEIGETLQ